MGGLPRDTLLDWGVRAAAGLAALIILAIGAFVLGGALPALAEPGVWAFVADGDWYPEHRAYGLAPMLAGSVLLTLGAVLLAVPLGLASALFVHFQAGPRVGAAFRRVVELLGGVPSVVWGLWGLTTVVPLVRALQPPGASLLAGSMVLALMIVPTIALFADAAIGAVPASYRQAIAALGLSRWTGVRRVILPAARGGLIAGVIMATGRALGETMAVLMVAGNVVQIPGSVFEPVRALTANIALEMAYATATHRAALFVCGLLLLMLVLGLVVVAALAQRQGRRHE